LKGTRGGPWKGKEVDSFAEDWGNNKEELNWGNKEELDWGNKEELDWGNKEELDWGNKEELDWGNKEELDWGNKEGLDWGNHKEEELEEGTKRNPRSVIASRVTTMRSFMSLPLASGISSKYFGQLGSASDRLAHVGKLKHRVGPFRAFLHDGTQLDTVNLPTAGDILRWCHCEANLLCVHRCYCSRSEDFRGDFASRDCTYHVDHRNGYHLKDRGCVSGYCI
jgi:hypothetical protein